MESPPGQMSSDATHHRNNPTERYYEKVMWYRERITVRFESYDTYTPCGQTVDF